MDMATSGAISNFFQINPNQKKVNCLGALTHKGVSSVTTNSNNSSSSSFFGKFIKKDEIGVPPVDDEENARHRDAVQDDVVSCDNNDDLNCVKRLDERYNLDLGNDPNPVNCAEPPDKSGKREAQSKTIQRVESNLNKKINSIQGLFSKQSEAKVKYKSDSLKEISDKQVGSIGKKNNNSIKGFFKNQRENEVINPLDVFPDLSIIDDDMLKSFPLSFRRKVLDLKKIEGQEAASLSCINSKLKMEEKKPDNCLKFKTQVNVDCGTSEVRAGCETSPNNCSLGNERLGTSKSNNYGCSTSNEEELKRPKTNDWDNEDIFEETSTEMPSTSMPVQLISEYFPDTMETCPECGEKFVKSEIPEHMDFHLAQRLSLEMNAEANHVSSTSSASLSNPPVKRKQSGRGRKISEIKKCKTLKTFFCS